MDNVTQILALLRKQADLEMQISHLNFLVRREIAAIRCFERLICQSALKH